MKPIVCLYCEGSDAKLAVMSKDKDGIKILRTASLTMTRALRFSETTSKRGALAEIENQSLSEDLSFDSLEAYSGDITPSQTENISDVSLLHSAIADLNVTKLDYLPVVTEPIVNYHVYEGLKEKNKNKLIQAIKNDLLVSKGLNIDLDMIDAYEVDEKTLLGVYLEGELPCVGLVNQLANYNQKRFLKIPTIKTAELPLAYFVSKSNKFFPEDYSLIIYIGKEYSKLIFLDGQKLKHIGSTLDIGTKNLHTYDVYFSKILLEMENGGIPKLDNIIICGEDRSENLILSFYGTFPEANVTELKFENFDTSRLNEEDVKNLALFAIPISVGVEYFDEQDKLHKGVNFLPKFVIENQKIFQFAWHGYALIPLLFASTFFFTFHILQNIKEMKDIDLEIERLKQRQLENQALVDQITPLDAKINAFDATQAILDSASFGAGVWNKNLTRLCDFMERRRSFWITKIEPVTKDELKLTGYSLTRSVLTEFADLYKNSIIRNINYEPLREKDAFSFTLNYIMSDDSTKIK
ncbi:MAG: hypothetical protein N2321_03780 [Melioribacteraceae bacterium]|nr:hypothetical protein [Melioribacteraceae bacterium]